MEIPDLTQPAWQHLLEHIKAPGWHVELHRAARDLPALITVLLKSGVKIVVDHFALPSQEEKQNDPGFQFLLEHAETQQIWLKLSGAYRNGSTETLNDNVAPLIPLLLQHFGPAHLLWGSDWPHTRYENVVNYQKRSSY